MSNRFPLAAMSPLILIFTLVLLVLPVVFVGGAMVGQRLLLAPALFLVAIYLWVWLRFRPHWFVVTARDLELVWPLKRRRVSRNDIAAVQIIDRKTLRTKVGWALRVGAGGLWGGFGWLWTKRRGIVQMYVSRIDEFVWIECREGRPLLITPERPTDFVRALTGRRASD